MLLETDRFLVELRDGYFEVTDKRDGGLFILTADDLNRMLEGETLDMDE